MEAVLGLGFWAFFLLAGFGLGWVSREFFGWGR